METPVRRNRRIRRGPRPFQHPLFRRVFAVAVAGHLVRFIDFTIVAWLVVQLTDSSSAVGLLIFFRVIPFLILGPVVGTLLDRFPRIAIFRLTQLGMAVTAALFGAAVVLDLASLPVIYAYTLVMGILFMAEIPSKRAYMSGIVGPAALGSALALDMVSLNLSWFAGSNLGGLVAKLINPGWAYMAIGAVFFANFIVLRKLPVMFRRSAEENAIGPMRSFVEGFRYARGNQAIFAGLLVVGINNFFGYPFESMAAAFASDIYDAGPTQFGLLMSAQGLGATITAGYIAVMGRRLRNPGKYLIVAAMIQAVGNIGFSYTTTVTTGFLAIMTLGLIQMVFGITHTMLILLAAPSNLRGRVMGFQVLMMGLFPVGSLALGIAGDAIGLPPAVRVFSITGFILLSLVWIFYPKLRRPIV